MTRSVDDVFPLAAALRTRHGQLTDKVTFTHIPVVTEPAEALDLLRSSALGSLLVDEGAVLNTPTTDWYVPIEPVRAEASALVALGITASTWEPPAWDFTAAELTLRLIYAATAGDERTASQDLRLYVGAGKPPSLSRWTYDHQRAETGYDGEHPVWIEPSSAQLDDMLRLIQHFTGDLASRG